MRLMDCVPALLAAGVMLYLLWRLFRAQAALRREREENRRLRGVLEESARVAQADSDRLRQLRHDLRHYLLLAESGAAGQGEAEALRTALEQAPASGRESWAVAALERHYLAQAQALGFQADLRLVPPQNWEGIVPDLYLVVSNLLENALEALQREGGGWLRVRSVSTAGYYSLVVGNCCTRPLRSINGRYLSSKAPGRFGIGLSTVQSVARRCGGQAEFTVENGEFRATVFLPRPKPETSPGRARPDEDEAVHTVQI